MTNVSNARKSPRTGRAAPARASRAQVAAHVPETLITYRVSVLAQALARLVDAAVREDLGLSSRQWRVLVVLNRLGPTTSGEVARMAHYDHSQVSRVAFELAERGLLVQGSDASDRRKQILTLTAAGLDCLGRGLPGSLQREQRLRERLTAAEHATLCRTLEALEAQAGLLLQERRDADAGRASGRR